MLRAALASKFKQLIALTALVAAGVLALHSASAQQGVKRTELQRYDLSVPGREMIQVRVDLEPGVTFPMHRIRARRSFMCSKALGNMRSRARAH